MLALAASVVGVRRRQQRNVEHVGGAGGAGGRAGGQKVDAATAGDVKGMVTLDGTAPKNEAIKMNADPVCVKENKTPQFQETYEVGSDGKSLANVFVYVKDGLGNYVYDTPTEPARSTRRTAATIRTCSACASASRSRSSTAIRRCTTSTRCRRTTRNSTTASRFRA